MSSYEELEDELENLQNMIKALESKLRKTHPDYSPPLLYEMAGQEGRQLKDLNLRYDELFNEQQRLHQLETDYENFAVVEFTSTIMNGEDIQVTGRYELPLKFSTKEFYSLEYVTFEFRSFFNQYLDFEDSPGGFQAKIFKLNRLQGTRTFVGFAGWDGCTRQKYLEYPTYSRNMFTVNMKKRVLTLYGIDTQNVNSLTGGSKKRKLNSHLKKWLSAKKSVSKKLGRNIGVVKKGSPVYKMIKKEMTR